MQSLVKISYLNFVHVYQNNSFNWLNSKSSIGYKVPKTILLKDNCYNCSLVLKIFQENRFYISTARANFMHRLIFVPFMRKVYSHTIVYTFGVLPLQFVAPAKR